MASRIFWFLLAGAALIGGMAWQGDGIFSWDDDGRGSATTERMIEGRVERVVERSLDGMQVTDADGREIDVSRETKRALSDAIGRLVQAQTDLAFLRIQDGSSREITEATARRDKARADVERIKAELKRQEQIAAVDGNALREEIQREVREDVRTAVRDAVGN